MDPLPSLSLSTITGGTTAITTTTTARGGHQEHHPDQDALVPLDPIPEMLPLNICFMISLSFPSARRCNALTVPQQRKQPPRSTATAAAAAAEDQPLSFASSCTIRPATPKDAVLARKIFSRNAMNPTSVSEDRLLVAVAPSPGKDTENGGRGAQQEEEDETVVGFGQIRPLDSSYSELASLYVDPAYRGRGIGTKIVRELLRRHDDAVRARRRGSPAGGPEPPPGGGSVCLLTLQPTAPFYEAHGFRAVSRDSEAFRRMPASVRLEHAAGTALSALLGNQLACMVRDPAE